MLRLKSKFFVVWQNCYIEFFNLHHTGTALYRFILESSSRWTGIHIKLLTAGAWYRACSG